MAAWRFQRPETADPADGAESAMTNFMRSIFAWKKSDMSIAMIFDNNQSYH
jgi:hypothetical protein